MSFELGFRSQALNEWKKLPPNIRAQFESKLRERLENPRVPSAALSALRDCYKIKLRQAGYRLVYQVVEREILVIVVAVGRRERNLVYRAAASRLE